MNTKRILYKVAAPMIFTSLALCNVACNEKSEDEPEATDASVVECVAVNSFSLKANSEVMENMDSVFFSIDLEHGVIFNADSLPKGTDISKLVATIKYPNTVTSAVINTIDKEYKYSENPADSIDFSHGATLTLKAGDNLEKSYRIKVNVHSAVPDTLVWTNLQSKSLPQELLSARKMKTVLFNDKAYTFFYSADNVVKVAIFNNLGDTYSVVKSVENISDARIETLTACGNHLFMLGANGNLLMADSYDNWSDSGLIWDNIIGEYSSVLLGLRSENGKTLHTAYPLPSDFSESTIDPDFPVSGFSNTGLFSSAWAPEPTLFIVGGKTASGMLVSGTWAYDGENWSEIANRPLPAMQDMSLVPYFAFRRPSSTIWTLTEFSVWLAIGGRNADNSPSANVYISYDNGVNWDLAPSYMQLPDDVPPLYAMDALVGNTPKSADLADNWRKVPTPRRAARISYNINGTDISWLCPYIYIYGGFEANGKLNTNVWRAVLARLTFTPII